MTITGAMLIGAELVRGSDSEMRAVDPASGRLLDPVFGGGNSSEVDRACRLAARDFDAFRSASLETRALLLESIAQGIIDLGDELIERAMSETALTRPRLEGERARTCGQLRLFAALVREGRWLSLTIDSALPSRRPLARPDLRSRRIPVGPVAVFGASNFPLAFSVAGGDTASALAAGCPVVAKSHPSHLGTSELVGRVIQVAVAHCGLPEGTFSLLVGKGIAVGQELVSHPAIQAVAFTGSRKGGHALVATVASRPQPIPVFAEMSSTNPVFLLPAALRARGASLAIDLIDSVTMGVGQFCTKPGIVFGIEGSQFTEFSNAAASALEGIAATTMLNEDIQRAYGLGIGALISAGSVKHLASGMASASTVCAGQPMLFTTTARAFLADPLLADEVFGPVTLLVACKDGDEMLTVANYLDGQLTATLQLDRNDFPLAHRLLPVLERKAGRILINGFPTGVEVAYAMVHGGPPPSTSDSRVTSVGAMAIDRFLRPVCYQNFPADLLPTDLRDDNPTATVRLINGKLQQG